jgi:valyl-tRNA synthetase
MPEKTEIQKTYNPSEVEDNIYKKWEESGYFNPDKCIKDNIILEDADSFSIIMPPPNATGVLHLGHAVMLALEDILIRYHRMRGEKALWIPGTDHAAIATQTKVEKIIKKEGTSRHELGREKFLKRVEDFVEGSRNTIRKQVRKMGSSCDWSREAYTLDDVRTKAVRSVFKMMYDDGLIYRGERIVNWCPRCHSTLADDEVEYKEQKAKIYTFKYDKNFPFSISTTRPETKLGDVAVAVNPKDKRYKKYIGEVFEADFCGVLLKLKIIADRNVDMDFGTGAVGVTPAHSMADWQMKEENDLEIIKVIDEDGNIREGFGEFSGKKAEKARELIFGKLKDNGLIEKEEEIDNKLSLCYRCDTPVEPLPSLQWFIDVNKKIPKYGKTIKEMSIDAVKSSKIRVIPERFEKNYFHWMENLRDWCVSRQIWFGHRIPVWYRGAKTQINEQDMYVGVEPPQGDGWVQDSDTLDTWFSSGMWTFSTMANKPDQIKLKDGKIIIDSEDFKNYHPTAVLETGYDILFFWVARMIIMTTYATGDIPFNDVYLHGLIRDDKGRKMSKSLGNVIDPLDMIEKYGTDAVRLSLVIGTTPGNDMRLSEEKIAGFRNFANKLWNMFRYIMISIYENPKRKDKTDDFLDEDKAILNKLERLVGEITDDLDNYHFSQAGEKLKEFTWNEFADRYLEKVKMKNRAGSISYIFGVLLKLWHPFIPFVTEEIWNKLYSNIDSNTYKRDLLMIQQWPAKGDVLSKSGLFDREEKEFDREEIIKLLPQTEKEIELIDDIIKVIRNARSENKIEPSKKVKAIIYAGKNKKLVESQAHLIKNLKTGIEEIEIQKKGEKIKNAIYATVDDIDIYLIGAIDFEKEKERLVDEIEEVKKYIKQVEGKLNNQEFVNNAPEVIVNKEKEKLAAQEEKLEKLEVNLGSLE